MHYKLLSQRTLLAGLLLAALVPPAARAQSRTALDEARNRMVTEEIAGAGIKNKRVIEAMRSTPRHEFVPAANRKQAYYDMALPIGESQTISPPFVVAYMTEALDPQPGDKVLEIGTGSGYQTAVLAKLCRKVYTIERLSQLQEYAQACLGRLKIENVEFYAGDGTKGWPDEKQFDRIIVTAAAPKIPLPLIDQLKIGGKIVIPIGGTDAQELICGTKTDSGKVAIKNICGVRFVKLIGQYGYSDE
jgi:protein-L-isoaspartate(D-aspartate) O-methyltransferase